MPLAIKDLLSVNHLNSSACDALPRYAQRVLQFEIVSHIRHQEVIASGHAIHILNRLIRLYGRGNWRKMKGIATVRFEDGTIAEAELHWFEAHGIGKRRMKIKYLTQP
jgi:hypothetical protein